MFLCVSEVLIDEEELFPDDALSTHTDMVDNEPVVNEARRQFMRYPFSRFRPLDLPVFF